MAIGHAHGNMSPNGRRAIAAAFVLIGHGVILWGLIGVRPNPVDQNNKRVAPVALWPVDLWSVPPKTGPAVKVNSAKPQGHKTDAPKSAGLVQSPNDAVPAAAPVSTGVDVAAATRQALALALQNNQACVARVQAGKPVPAACHMGGLVDHAPLGPKPDADFEAAAAHVDYILKYKTTPGNSDYWKRVGGATLDRDMPLCSARPGTYSNAKDQRVWRCWAPDPRNGVAVP